MEIPLSNGKIKRPNTLNEWIKTYCHIPVKNRNVRMQKINDTQIFVTYSKCTYN